MTAATVAPVLGALLVLGALPGAAADGIVKTVIDRYVALFTGRAFTAPPGGLPPREPVPPYPSSEYPLLTLGKTRLLFRPHLFKLEALSLAVVLVFVLVYLQGRTSNRSRARSWLQAASPSLITDFAHIGAPASAGAGTDRLIWNGADEALLYASGRRGVRALEVLFDFFPRHDLVQTLFWPLWDLAIGSTFPTKRDLITVRFVLPRSTTPLGVFALVNKSDLRETQKGRYDLGFAQLRLNAVEQRGLDPNWVLINEAADVTDSVLGPVVGSNKPRQDGILPDLQAFLADPDVRDSLASVTVTDLPFYKPEGPVEEPAHHIVLSLRPGRSLERATPAILTVAYNIVDAIDQGLWRPSPTVLTKLKKTRADANAALLKEVRADKEAEEEAAREAARKQAAKDKLAKLSPAEQEKRRELEKKRQMRKSGAKMKMR